MAAAPIAAGTGFDASESPTSRDSASPIAAVTGSVHAAAAHATAPDVIAPNDNDVLIISGRGGQTAVKSRAARILQTVVGSLIAWALVIALITFTDEAPSRHAKLPDYLRPFRPLPIRVINAIGLCLGKIGLLDRVVSLDPDYLISSACSKLGPTDPKSNCVLLDDDEHWHTSFHRLVSSLQETNLTMLGRVIAQGQMQGILQTRGQLLKEFEKDPSTATNVITDPVIIVGLPRTGTTFLSRLLAIDPVNRSPSLWEYMDPVPRPPPPPPIHASRAEVDAYQEETKDRIAEQQWKLEQYKALAPGVDALHPLNATNPEECIIIMNMAMDSEQMAVTFPIHEYMEWLLSFEHHKDALQWNKRVLQHLQHNDPYGPRRWVIKTPYYLTMLDDLKAVYPNAKIVHTHRDPGQSMLSASSIIAKLHGIVTDDIDLHRILAQQVSMHEHMVEKALKVRKQWASEEANTNNSVSSFRIVDVHLHDLQRDPIGTVDTIYRALFDTKLTTETASLMQDYLNKNTRTKHGTHRPTMSEFGIKGFVESDIFREYKEIFQTKRAATIDAHTRDKRENESQKTKVDEDAIDSEL